MPRSMASVDEHLHVAAAVAEADDLLLAGQRLEAVVADGAGDDEVEAVRADVEGGEAPTRSSISR